LMMRRQLFATGLFSLALMSQAQSVSAAEEALIKLSAQQRQSAGIVIEAVRSAEQAGAAAPQGQLLPGRVVVPNERRDVVLAGVSGRLEALLVNPGDIVQAGQPLLRLYSAELVSLQRAFLSARSSQELAHKRLLRDEALFADGIIAESRLQDSRDQALQAAATEQEQRQLLQLAGLSAAALAKLRSATDLTARVTVLAPRSGRVLEQPEAVGSQVEAWVHSKFQVMLRPKEVSAPGPIRVTPSPDRIMTL
jgi:multidrug resistance efflux pump